ARNPRVKATGLPAPGPATSTGASEEAAYQELARQYEQFRQIDRTFELVAKAVSPAVVHIVARKPSPGEEGRRRRAYEETGSGVIVRAGAGRGDLYVLTANHVVAGASAPEISIALLDGRVIRPDRFWTDGMLDVAVLKLGRDDLPAARLGDSDTATVGSWVLALGSPFGLTHSVSQGIISARQRHESSLRNDGVENQDFLQTDAAINPGNSGGPLVNMKGEVIGINTAIASNGGGSEGVGFSIPINMAKWAMGQLIASGKVSRAALGVNLEEVGPESALKLGLDRPRGAQVLNVHPLSPAAKAGVRDGDVVLRFGGVEVVDLNHLINMVAMTPIGQEVEVVVWREGRELARVVTLADRDKTLALGPVPAPTEPTGPRSLLRRSPRPGPSPAETGTPAVASAPDLGLELVTLDPETAQGLGLPEASRGVAVTGIEPSSPLTPVLQPLDVLSAADGQPIRTAEDAIRILTPRPGRAAVELDVQRRVNGTMRGRTIRIPGL
ncbi:MAG TPA: trypsin-like peptidase domain-containing protein, partial [Isosphaeraceae bacterium]